RERLVLGPVDVGVRRAVDDDVGPHLVDERVDGARVGDVEPGTRRRHDGVTRLQLLGHGPAELASRADDQHEELHDGLTAAAATGAAASAGWRRGMDRWPGKPLSGG